MTTDGLVVGVPDLEAPATGAAGDTDAEDETSSGAVTEQEVVDDEANAEADADEVVESDGDAVDGASVDAVDGASVDAVIEAIEAAGATARVAAPAELAGVDLHAIVARGEAALQRVARQVPDAPILPVAVDPGVSFVPDGELESALEEVVAERADVERHAVVDVQVDGTGVGRIFRDATLLTSEPARISEFAIESDVVGAVDEVRSDGVAVTTTAGSHGYAAAGGGPLLAPGAGLAVVPIAPFRIDRSHWVLPARPLSIQIRRDEAAVTLELDGEARETVGKDATVTLDPASHVETLVVEESRPLFG